jgi:hypothetical protein
MRAGLQEALADLALADLALADSGLVALAAPKCNLRMTVAPR